MRHSFSNKFGAIFSKNPRCDHLTAEVFHSSQTNNHFKERDEILEVGGNDGKNSTLYIPTDYCCSNLEGGLLAKGLIDL